MRERNIKAARIEIYMEAKGTKARKLVSVSVWTK